MPQESLCFALKDFHEQVQRYRLSVCYLEPNTSSGSKNYIKNEYDNVQDIKHFIFQKT